MVFLLMEYSANKAMDSTTVEEGETEAANQSQGIMAEGVDKLLAEVQKLRRHGFYGERPEKHPFGSYGSGTGAAVPPPPRVGLILMGDEFHSFPLSAYGAFDLVLRHHYDQAHCEGTSAGANTAAGDAFEDDAGGDAKLRSHVHWIPLGPSPGYLSMGTKARSGSNVYQYFANFIGNVRSTVCTGKRCYLIPYRKNAVAALHELHGHSCSTTSSGISKPTDVCHFCQQQHGNTCSDSDRTLFVRSNSKYAQDQQVRVTYSTTDTESQAEAAETEPLPLSTFHAVVHASRFTICVPGSSAESTRMYEALLADARVHGEAGQEQLDLLHLSIPIVSADHHQTIPLELLSKAALVAIMRAHERHRTRRQESAAANSSWVQEIDTLAGAIAVLGFGAGAGVGDRAAWLQAALSPFPLPTVSNGILKENWFAGLGQLLRRLGSSTDLELDELRGKIGSWWRSCQHLLQLGLAALVEEQVEEWRQQWKLKQKYKMRMRRGDGEEGGGQVGERFSEQDEYRHQQYEHEYQQKLSLAEQRWHPYHWLRECHRHIGAREYEWGHESATAALELMSVTPKGRSSSSNTSIAIDTYGPQWKEWDALLGLQALALQGVSLIKQVCPCWSLLSNLS
jgi:hypothetical protein